MKSQHFATALILAFVIGSANAQSLSVGPMTFSLGMKKADVMPLVQEKFHLVPVTGQSTIFLSETKPPNVKVIGGIAFENDRISWIQRNWGSYYGKASVTVVNRALFSALESAGASTGTSATINTKSLRVPGTEFKTVDFIFPHRKVSITSSESEQGNGDQQVTIDESISNK